MARDTSLRFHFKKSRPAYFVQNNFGAFRSPEEVRVNDRPEIPAVAKAM